jgi:hypothetical protein
VVSHTYVRTQTCTRNTHRYIIKHKKKILSTMN